MRKSESFIVSLASAFLFFTNNCFEEKVKVYESFSGLILSYIFRVRKFVYGLTSSREKGRKCKTYLFLFPHLTIFFHSPNIRMIALRDCECFDSPCIDPCWTPADNKNVWKNEFESIQHKNERERDNNKWIIQLFLHFRLNAWIHCQ